MILYSYQRSGDGGSMTTAHEHYHCSICNADYKVKEMAKECEAQPVEEQIFQLGDEVRGKEWRLCMTALYKAKNKKEAYYIPVGKVVKAAIPDPGRDYKVFGCLNSHRLLYAVEYVCPLCGERRDVRGYEEDFEAASKK